MVFPVVMYGCESWTVKKAERQSIDAFELWCWRRLLRVLDCKEIQPVHSEGDQPWYFYGGNDAKAETPVLWAPHAKSWLIGKDSDAGRDWGQEEKRTTEEEMAGWHHWLDGHESEWTPGVRDEQGGLASCDPWGHKESDTTERLNWTELREWSYLENVYTSISDSSAFPKPSLCSWKFSVHVLLKPSLKNFEHYLASMWNECNCEVVWTFTGITWNTCCMKILYIKFKIFCQWNKFHLAL